MATNHVSSQMEGPVMQNANCKSIESRQSTCCHGITPKFSSFLPPFELYEFFESMIYTSNCNRFYLFINVKGQ